MKKILFSIVVLAAIALVPSRAMAQSETTDAAANIIAPISITETSPLHFGSMSVSASTAGTCVLSTTGSRSATNGVTLSSANPAATNAAYSVSGEASVGFTITLPATITVTETTTSTTMTIDNLKARVGGAGADGTTGTLNGSGAATFTIGGTLNVIGGQAAELYEGTFNVAVAYN